MKRKNLIIISLAVALFFCKIAQAATYYMPDNFANLQAAFSGMSSGDTLIIRDGTYTGSTNAITTSVYPPVGSAGNYTKIKAEHDGQVIFDGQNTRNMFDHQPSLSNKYWQFEGIIWCRAVDSTIILIRSRYVKFLRCGAYDTGAGNRLNFNIGRECDYILLENCYAWGSGRYKFASYEADHIIFRQCVGRLDRVDSSGEPIAIYSIYASSDVEVQNCIAIDSDQTAYWANVGQYAGSFFVPCTSGISERVNFKQCLSVNVLLGGCSSASNTDSTDVLWENCLVWDCEANNGIVNMIRGSDNIVRNCTFGITDSSSVYMYADGANTTVSNSIFYDITSSSHLLQYADIQDYNCFYGNSSSNIISGTHNVNTNPLTNSLRYLPRIESGSTLDGAGVSGADIGANCLKMIGVPGTLWGETGYNVEQVTNMWPFPNEDVIRTKMKAYDSGGVSGNRGFCADSTTLTKYIWEYLGNTIPAEIYGASILNITTSSLADGVINTSYSQTLSVSGGTMPYVWSLSSGTLPAGLSLNSATGAITGTPSSAGTVNFTVQVTDNNSNTDTQNLSIIVIAPDTTAPVISSVMSSGTTASGTTISWNTNESATSQVEYGTSISYGSVTVLDTNLVTAHSVSISGLNSETTYHFRVKSKDAANNEAVSSDNSLTTSAAPVINNMLQDFEDNVLWVPNGAQDPEGYGRGWAFTTQGVGDSITIDSIGANGTNRSLKVTFTSTNDCQIYFRSDDKTTDHMPEAQGANRIGFYVRFPADYPIQPLPFRYNSWQFGTYIHDPDNWSDTNAATYEEGPGIHHYYHRVTMEQVGNGWVKYIFDTHPDQANYSGTTVPPDRGSEYYDNYGRFYFHFGGESGGPEPARPVTIWIDEIKFYYDDGSVGGNIHSGGDDDAGFYGEFFADEIVVTDTTSPQAVTNLAVASTTTNSVNLSWTAPGDDGAVGTATSYDVRYSTAIINTSNWASATQATGEPSPSVAGTSQTMTISGLSAQTTYYFTIKTSDEAANISLLSNVASDTTDSLPDTNTPYTTGHFPAKSAVNVDKDSNIVVHVKDDGAGVDISTIVMKVNGQVVTPTITGTPADYTLTYNPPVDFDYGETINVTIDAEDLAN
ncbi:MAG: putative Ig domain-containing protein [Candidatus Omnitrophota bacterium]